MHAPLPIARRDVIAARLAAGQPVVAAALAQEFEVSEDAVRRDLRALAAEGRCRRVYGGALPVTPQTQPVFARIDESRERKAALARRAAETIRPGELLFLDAGSTNLALVDCLPEDQELAVATNAVDIAAAVLRRPDLRLLMVGGTVDPTVGGAVDASATQAVGRLDVDRCFLGACGVDARGVAATLHADGVFKRALVAVSRQCVVLALNEKLRARASHRACTLAEVGLLVVEHDAPPRALEPLRAAGAQLARAARLD